VAASTDLDTKTDVVDSVQPAVAAKASSFGIDFDQAVLSASPPAATTPMTAARASSADLAIAPELTSSKPLAAVPELASPATVVKKPAKVGKKTW
jgi:hypothetical protein